MNYIRRSSRESKKNLALPSQNPSESTPDTAILSGVMRSGQPRGDPSRNLILTYYSQSYGISVLHRYSPYAPYQPTKQYTDPLIVEHDTDYLHRHAILHDRHLEDGRQ
ncbi:hypothetical protein N7530_000799 [Penicillium desertorum]|uniref:Uncharacterized protein n=1 Tax=Penicillium desertorum TaxID=1303715 RepID=A0A9W9X990_9EURO|nr:hypothetical protein N7530_000799 [Penicillium desertorum]